MSCVKKNQVKLHGGHVVLLHEIFPGSPNTPSLVGQLQKSCNGQPFHKLSPEQCYLPTLRGVPTNVLPPVEKATHLARSAAELGRHGGIAVVALHDPTLTLTARIAQALHGTSLKGTTSVTNALLFAPLASVATLPAANALRGFVAYPQLVHATFAKTPRTVDVLTRDDFEHAFETLATRLAVPLKVGLPNLKQHLTQSLGLDAHSTVYLEPRHPQIFDIILLPQADGEKLAARYLLAELGTAQHTGRYSALAKPTSAKLLHVLADGWRQTHPGGQFHCGACAQRDAALLHDPNARFNTAEAAASACLACMKHSLAATHPSISGTDLQATPEAIVPTGTGVTTTTTTATGVTGAAPAVAAAVATVAVPPVVDVPLGPENIGSRGALGKLSYNQVTQKSSSQSVLRTERLEDQLNYHRIRSIELDLGTHKGSFLWRKEAPAMEWFTNHPHWYDMSKNSPTCDFLSEALLEVQAFHQAFPAHEIITVFLNMWDGFPRGHRAEELDATLERWFGQAIFKPADLRQELPSIQEAITQRGWPSLDALAGRVMFVVGEGSNAYAANQEAAEKALCFCMATNVESATAIKDRNWVTFFNLPRKNGDLSEAIFKSGLISRQVGCDTQHDFDAAMNQRAHHLVTSHVNFHSDPWARTHNRFGYPFLPFEIGAVGDVTTAREPQNVLSLLVTSADIWGRKDDCAFDYHIDETTPEGQWIEYSFAVPNANSHVPKYARAGFCFRAHPTEPGAVHFAVLRPAHRLVPARVERREQRDEATSEVVSTNPLAYFFKARCQYTKSGDTLCEAYESADGVTWTALGGPVSLPDKLRYHGWVATSYGNRHNPDGTQIAFLIGNPARDGRPLGARDFAEQSRIGKRIYDAPRFFEGIDSPPR